MCADGTIEESGFAVAQHFYVKLVKVEVTAIQWERNPT